jgi:hypothetical protein
MFMVYSCFSRVSRHDLNVPLFDSHRDVHNAEGIQKPNAKPQDHDNTQDRFDGW